MRKTAAALVALGALLLFGWSGIPADQGCHYAKWSQLGWTQRQLLRLLEYTHLSDFTVPVTVTAEQTTFWEGVRSDGADVRFADCDGQPMSFELESFDYEAQKMVAWVRVPLIGADARFNGFFMYYANPRAEPPPAAEAWGPAYQLVLHMAPALASSKPGLRDSSRRAHPVRFTDGRTTGSHKSGAVGEALVLDGSGGLEIAEAEDWSFSDSDWTVELWARLPPTVPGKTDQLLSFSRGPKGTFNLYRHSGGFLVLELSNEGGVSDISFVQTVVTPNEWTYVALTREKGMVTLWVGGRRFGMSLKTPDFVLPEAAGPLLIGAGAYGFATVELDEVRVTKGVARPQSWIEVSGRAAAGPMYELMPAEAEPVWFTGRASMPASTGCNSANWSEEGWAQRQLVTLRERTDLVDFTIPVTITAEQTAFWSTVRSDGADVRFTECDGQPLPFELESFNHHEQKMVAWVRVPEIGARARFKSFFVYSGNPNAAPLPAAEVWGPDYQLVLHLASASGSARFGLHDSSRRKHAVTLTNGVSPVFSQGGVFGEALAFEATNAVEIPQNDDWSFGSSDWTIEFWARLPPTVPGHSTQLFSFNRGPRDTFNLYRHFGGFLVLELANNGVVADMSFLQAVAPPNVWTHVALTREKGMMSVLLGDRHFQIPLKTPDFALPQSDGPLLLGTGVYGFATMELDEVRISRGVARSRSWLEASGRAAGGQMYVLKPAEVRQQ